MNKQLWINKVLRSLAAKPMYIVAFIINFQWHLMAAFTNDVSKTESISHTAKITTTCSDDKFKGMTLPKVNNFESTKTTAVNCLLERSLVQIIKL